MNGLPWIVGIDPGLSGALAFMHASTMELVVHDMPTLAAGKGGRNELDLAALSSLLDRDDLAHAFVEAVHAMPGNGATSMFRFGAASMAPLAMLALLRVPVTRVTPQRWKRTLSVPAAKDGARARASELMPPYAHLWGRAKDDGRAEAALLAYYGIRQLGQQEAA